MEQVSLPRYVTIPQFADCLKVSTKTIERGIASGLFIATRVRGAVRLNLDRNLARLEPPETGGRRRRAHRFTGEYEKPEPAPRGGRPELVLRRPE
jgi:hypothetical protein